MTAEVTETRMRSDEAEVDEADEGAVAESNLTIRMDELSTATQAFNLDQELRGHSRQLSSLYSLLSLLLCFRIRCAS